MVFVPSKRVDELAFSCGIVLLKIVDVSYVVPWIIAHPASKRFVVLFEPIWIRVQLRDAEFNFRPFWDQLHSANQVFIRSSVVSYGYIGLCLGQIKYPIFRISIDRLVKGNYRFVKAPFAKSRVSATQWR